jgi:hypothetical protein
MQGLVAVSRCGADIISDVFVGKRAWKVAVELVEVLG